MDFERVIPEGAREGAPLVVLLHGRGADRFDLLGLAPHLAPDAVMVTPQAPFPGAPWGYGPGWAWYRYVAEDRVDEASFSRGQEALEGFLEMLPNALPLRTGPLVLGGFSQGGTMSVACALRNPGRHPRVMCFSGFLARHPEVRAAPETVAGTRFFWGHGTEDPAIPFSLAVRGRAALLEAGAALDAYDYPIGHGISPDEVRDARAWLEASLAEEEAGG
jgi:phospholipase/carboxylesterase